MAEREVEWTPMGRATLEATTHVATKPDELLAARHQEQIRAEVQKVADTPHLCHELTGTGKHELPVTTTDRTAYAVTYRFDDRHVEISHVEQAEREPERRERLIKHPEYSKQIDPAPQAPVTERYKAHEAEPGRHGVQPAHDAEKGTVRDRNPAHDPSHADRLAQERQKPQPRAPGKHHEPER